MKRKSGFLTFICACVPGCGQMYLGYMKRGLSLAALFWLTIACADFLLLDAIFFCMPVIWLYAFFDTYNIRSQTVEEHNAMPDQYILDGGVAKTVLNKNRKTIGWICIVLGCVLLYNVLVVNLLVDYLWNYMPFVASLLSYVPTLLVGVAIVWLGVRFAFGTHAEKPVAEEDDFQNYTGTQKKAAEYVSPFASATQSVASTTAQSAKTEAEQPIAQAAVTQETEEEKSAVEESPAAETQGEETAKEPKPKKGAKKSV